MQRGLCAADYQLDPDHQRVLPVAFQPGYFPAGTWRCGAGRNFARVANLAEYAREEINAHRRILCLFQASLSTETAFLTLIVTKLSVNTLDLGLAGIEVYDLLRDEYDIQIEFGDLGNILAYLSIGDRMREMERLCQRPVGNPPPVSKGYSRHVCARSTFRAAGGMSRLRRPFTQRKESVPLAESARHDLQRICHVLSRRASPFWPRVSGLPRRFWTISNMPRKRAVSHDRPGRPGHLAA